ncbi:MAG: segregation/condensation protein A [Candidatus Schekmanbacteria bacterium]|nr:segregation/condensation protein A [Candidatus Schekmanbacteria bacterium]
MATDDANNYKVQLPEFEGPMDLLLYLIKTNELNIYDIPIAFILDEYIKYVDMLKVLNLNTIGDFLVLAAQLIFIKSKMLLPRSSADDEAIEDPRTELVQKLLEYKQFKEASKQLGGREAYFSEMYSRKNPAGDTEKKEEIMLQVSVFDLIKAFERILSRTKEVHVREILVTRFSVNDKISWIMDLLEKNESLSIEQLFEPMEERMEMIITFLAMLELTKLHLIKVTQESILGRIMIYAN